MVKTAAAKHTPSKHPNSRLRTAAVTGPAYYRSLGEGLRLRRYHVWVNGKLAYSAPTEWQCVEWLVRTGWY